MLGRGVRARAYKSTYWHMPLSLSRPGLLVHRRLRSLAIPTNSRSLMKNILADSLLKLQRHSIVCEVRK